MRVRVAAAVVTALLAAGLEMPLTAASAQELPGEGVTVYPTDQNIPEEWFQTYLVSMGLEDLGYEVEESASMQMQAAFTAVANGDASFYAAYWNPLH
jgi:glycine betaine/proline transport system substrate-binding protein